MNNAEKRKTAKAVAERIASRYTTKEARLSASVIAHDAALAALGYGEPEAEHALTFTLTIELGSTNHGELIADVLHDLAVDFRPHSVVDGSGPVADLNGNTVGSWAVR